MKIKFGLFFLIYCNFVYTLPANITIRKATLQDLPALFDLDQIVSYEYFLPLYSNGYAHLPLGKNPEYFLKLELEEDKKWFPACVNGNAELLWIAYDNDNNKVVGLIIAHQSSKKTVEIDLLLMLQEYRKKGVGKALIYHTIDSFSDVAICEVYPLRFANDETLAFYQAIGFINQGIPTIDKVNLYGIHYKDMYYYFTYYINPNHSNYQVISAN